MFAPNGTAISNEFPINQVTTGSQWYHSLTSLSSGNVFVTWYGDQLGNYNYDIYGRLFDQIGTALGNEFPINQNTTGNQYYPSLTSLPNGNLFVMWEGYQTGNGDIYGRLFGPSGIALSNEFPINQNTTGLQYYSSVTSLANGNAFVTWVSNQTGNDDIYGRLFAPNGTALSNEFPINQNTTENQYYPSVTSLANGNAFVTWRGDQTGNGDIYGRLFAPNGTAISNEFPINQNTTGTQESPSLTSLANGKVFVTWSGSQTRNWDIYGRVFDPSGTALSNEFPINQVIMGSQVWPFLTSLSNGNAFVTWEGDQTGNNDIYGRILTASFLSAQVVSTTGGITTNQLTTAQVTTNGLTTGGVTTGPLTTKGFRTTGFMPTTSFGESQPSQEEGSSTAGLGTLGLGILGGFGGGALLTLGGIAAWKYYSYKSNKKSTPQSGQNRELELDTRTKSVSILNKSVLDNNSWHVSVLDLSDHDQSKPSKTSILLEQQNYAGQHVVHQLELHQGEVKVSFYAMKPLDVDQMKQAIFGELYVMNKPIYYGYSFTLSQKLGEQLIETAIQMKGIEDSYSALHGLAGDYQARQIDQKRKASDPLSLPWEDYTNHPVVKTYEKEELHGKGITIIKIENLNVESIGNLEPKIVGNVNTGNIEDLKAKNVKNFNAKNLFN